MAAEQESDRRETGKELRESITRAQTAINRLDNIIKQLAKRNRSPGDSRRYKDALIDVDMAVFDAYNRLRKYLKLDAEDYWCTKVVAEDQGQYVILGGPGGEGVAIDELEAVGNLVLPQGLGADDLVYFEAYQGAVETRVVPGHERFAGQQIGRRHYPKVLHPDGYRRTLRVLDEARRKLGFTPKPTETDSRTEITREMIEDVGEWRQENLPEEYLNNGNDTADD